jgi:hypothetical protein
MSNIDQGFVGMAMLGFPRGPNQPTAPPARASIHATLPTGPG